ncbi:MAG: succinate dehydrogenase assembly factor 2 [Pseudomonadota bacterium]
MASTPDSHLRALRWRCRRGMRELDVLLTHYLSHHYAAADSLEKAGFEALLDCQDPEIFSYVTGRAECQNPAIQNIVRVLQRGFDR